MVVKLGKYLETKKRPPQYFGFFERFFRKKSKQKDEHQANRQGFGGQISSESVGKLVFHGERQRR